MRKHGLRDYDELMARSTTDLDWFWRAVLDDLGIEFYEPYSRVLDTSRGIAWTRVVRRRSHEHRPQLPRQVDGHANGASPGAALGRRRRDHPHADLRGAAARGQSLRRRTARARRRSPATASRCSCRCARSWSSRSSRSSRSAASCCRCSPATAPTPSPTRLQDCGRQSADHRGRLLAARADGAR